MPVRDDIWRHLILTLVGAVLFSFESWAFGPFSWIYPYGAGLETLPAHIALSKSGNNFSLWAAFLAGGVDRLSFWGNADPFNIEPLMISALPIWAANGLHRFLQYFVAIFFTARVCYDQFRLDWRWACLAGWLHGAFAYFTFGELFAFPSVPLLLWTLSRIMAQRSLWPALVAGAAFSLLTTFSQSDPYLIVFAFGWILVVERNYALKSLLRFSLFFMVLLLADSPQFFAIILNAAESHRSNWPIESIDLSIDGLFYRQFQFDLFNQDQILRPLTLTLPGVSLLIGFAMALWAWSLRRERPDLAVTAVQFLRVFALYALASQRWLLVSLQHVASLYVQWFSGIYMGRFYTLSAAFLFACGVTLAANIIWHGLLTSQPFRRLGLAAMAGLIVFMAIEPKVFLFYPIGVEDYGQGNYQVAALDAIRQRETEPFRVASVLPLQPGYAYGQGLETVDGWANLYPSVYRDLWLRVIAPVMNQLPFVHNIFDPKIGRPQDNYIFLGADLINPGVGALPGEDPFQAISKGFDIDRRFNLDLLRMLNVHYLLSEYPLSGSGVSIVHVPKRLPTFPQARDYATGMPNGQRPQALDRHGFFGHLAGIWNDWKAALDRRREGKDIFIYRLENALPRYRLISKVLVEPNGPAVLDRLSTAGIELLSNTAVIEARDAFNLGGLHEFAEGTLRLVREAPGSIVLELDQGGPGYLLIANTWNPYWRAEVDGKPRTLVRTNHTQFGLQIAAGERRVILRYVPPYAPIALLERVTGIRSNGSIVPER